MALRFQRRLKIAPGLTLVASKRGLGVSVGAPGVRVSVGRRGIYRHLGIPGTGIAFRDKLNPSSQQRKHGAAPQDLASRLTSDGGASLRVRIEDDGSVSWLDGEGNGFAQDELRVLRRAFGARVREEVQEECERRNERLTALGQVHHGTPPPRTEPMFETGEFVIPLPTPESELKKPIWAWIWPPAARRVEAENLVRQARYEDAVQEWQAAKAAFDNAEAKRRHRETVAVKHDLEAMALTLEDYLATIPWPTETEVEFDLGNDSRTIAVTLHLPGEDAMPDIEWSMHQSQFKVNRKKLPATRRRALYRDYVHGVAVRVLGEIFCRLPTIQAALVTGLVPGTDRATGHAAEIPLCSVIARREDWQRLNFDGLEDTEPVETLALFALRRAMTKTGILKPVAAYTLEDLEMALD